MKRRAGWAAVVAFVLVVVVAPEATGKGGTPIVSCGQVVTTNAVLTLNLPCTGDGIVVGAPGITVDLNGHRLMGDGGAGDYGVDVGSFASVTGQERQAAWLQCRRERGLR